MVCVASMITRSKSGGGPPHSKTWRNHDAPSNRAERLGLRCPCTALENEPIHKEHARSTEGPTSSTPHIHMNPNTNKRLTVASGTRARQWLIQPLLPTCKRAASILFLTLLVTLSLAQPVTVTPVGEWPGFQRGPAQAVTVAGGYAYVAAGGVYIFDASQVTNLAPVGIYATPDARDVVVIGQRAYVADWETGFQIVDISDPAHPRRVGECSINGRARRMVVRDNHAYVASAPVWDGQSNQGGGLAVIDASNPTQPRVVGEYTYLNPPCVQCGGSAYDVAVAGNYAFVAEAWDETSSSQVRGTVAVIDVSDPTLPWLAGSYDTSSSGARSVTIAGSMAFVGNYNSFEGLQILDISNPTAPVRVGGYRLDGVGGEEPHVTVAGNSAYLALPSGLEGVTVLDISNPANPARVSGITLHPASSATSSAVADGKLYVAGRAGLIVFDVTQPENPVLLGDYDTTWGVRGMFIAGDRAFLTEGRVGLHVLDIGTSGQPVRVGTYRTTGIPGSLDVSGNFVYLTESSAWWGSGQDMLRLQVIDVSNPSTPERVGGLDIGPSQGWVGRVAHSDGYAYVAVPASGLHVIDARDRLNLSLVGTYLPTWGITGVVISGGHAYLSTYWYDAVAGRDRRRLEIVNVTDPTNLQRVGTIEDPSGVAIEGTRAYLAYSSYDYVTGQHSGALRVFDVSDPSAPTMLGEISTSGPVYFVTVAHGYAWLVGRLGLEGVDVSNPQSLSAAFLWEPPDPTEWSPQQITVSDRHVFIADSYRTLHVLRIDGLPEEIRLEVLATTDELRLRWPATASGFALESSTSLGSPTWDPVPGTPQLNGDAFEIAVPKDGPARFFRLRKP